jgi:hypothetical protein
LIRGNVALGRLRLSSDKANQTWRIACPVISPLPLLRIHVEKLNPCSIGPV